MKKGGRKMNKKTKRVIKFNFLHEKWDTNKNAKINEYEESQHNSKSDVSIHFGLVKQGIYILPLITFSSAPATKLKFSYCCKIKTEIAFLTKGGG